MCLGALDFRKVKKIRSILNSTIVDLIQNHRDILCQNPSRDFTRNRDFTPKKIFSTLLQFNSKNTESELIDICGCENSDRNINAAFLGQRKKLGDDCMPFLFRSFTNAISDEFYQTDIDDPLYGYHVLATDGSDVNIARNPHDPLTYIEKKGKRGYNQVHLNAIFDVSSNLCMAASIQGIHKKQERKAFVEMLHQLNCPGKAILTADRGYESFNIFAACKEIGAKFVIRLKDINSNGILSAYDLEDGEFNSYIYTKLTRSHANKFLKDPKTYTILSKKTDFDFFEEDGTYEIWFRIVRFRLPNGKYVAVATNLEEDEFNIKSIAAIYKLRWGCETAFRKVKHTIGLVNFHSWKMQYIKQELFARLIMYNFCSAIVDAVKPDTFGSATDDVPLPESDGANKPEPKEKRGIAFSQAVTVCRKLLVKCTVSFVKDAIETIRAHIYISKTGRSYKRDVKPKSCVPFCYKPS